MEKSVTRIVGWFRKKAFDGDINGKHVVTSEKIIFHLETTNVKDHHGIAVDTLKLLTPEAIALNGGNENLDYLIGAELSLEYQLYNGKPQLVDIVVLNAPKKA